MVEFGKQHYVNVGPGGTFQRSGKYETAPGDIDAIFTAFEAKPPERLTIHFHGGLINEEAGFGIARKLLPVYDAAGSHAISFVWETGPIETIVGRIADIGQTELFKKLLKLVLKQAAKRLGLDAGEGTGRGAGELKDQEMDAELSKDRPFETLDEPRARAGRARGGDVVTSEAELAAAEPEVLEEIEADIDSDVELQMLLDQKSNHPPGIGGELAVTGAKGPGLMFLAKVLTKVTFRVIKRYLNDRDHGFYPTVVEEILRELYVADLGETIWSGMKTKAAEMWKPNDGLAGDQQHAGSYFLAALDAYVKRHPGLRIDVVGHSAGSVAIAHMLEATETRHPELRFRHVILLAPACTSELFESKILPRLGARYTDFRMFTMSDAFESKDNLVPKIYTRSLLYFISGVLEDEVDKALLGMERYLSGQKPYQGKPFDSIRTFFATEGRAVLAQTAEGSAAGLSCMSTSHGFFDDDPVTQASLQHIIRQ